MVDKHQCKQELQMFQTEVDWRHGSLQSDSVDNEINQQQHADKHQNAEIHRHFDSRIRALLHHHSHHHYEYTLRDKNWYGQLQ